MQATTLRQAVRPMRLDDIAQVVEVEQQSFPSAWPTTAFKREIEHNRLARYLVATQQQAGVAPPEAGGEVILGFIGVWLLVDEAHVVTFAVREGYRGRGVGELLLIAAIETAQAEGQAVVTLECRVSNSVALRLYEKYGFQQVGLRPRYYSDDHEDAYVMSAGGIDTPSYRERFHRLRGEHRERWGEYGPDL